MKLSLLVIIVLLFFIPFYVFVLSKVWHEGKMRIMEKYLKKEEKKHGKKQ
jgi:hypothetical protein